MTGHDASTDGLHAILARHDHEIAAARDAYTVARMNAIAHLIRTSYPTATELVVTVGRHAAGWMVANPKALLDGERRLWDIARDDGSLNDGIYAYLTLRLTDMHTDATHESLGPLRWYTDGEGLLRAPLPPLRNEINRPTSHTGGTEMAITHSEAVQLMEDMDKGTNIFGALRPEVRSRLFNVIDKPSQATWADANGIILNATTMTTLWQALLAHTDYDVTTGPSYAGGKTPGPWPKLPTSEQLLAAIRAELTKA